MATRIITLRLATGALGSLAARGRFKLDARTTRLRETDRDGLLRRTCAVLTLANVMNLLPDELARLR